MRSAFALVLAMLPALAAAETWNCSNPDFEAGCSEGQCSVLESGFTPMSVAFNSDGDVSVCAYSGCWEGRGAAHRDERFISIHARGLSYVPDVNGDGDRHDLAILLDLADGVALLKSGGYAHPLLCRRIDQE